MRHPYALLRKAQCNPLYSNLQLISRSPTAATTSRVRCHSTHNHNHNHKHENTYKENVEVTIPTMDSPGPLNFSPEDVAGARKYCTELLSKHDYPSYILSGFVPASARDAYLAIRGFNVDVARVADQVSNVAVGKLRMQFWRDAIDKTYRGTPPKEPVAMLLAKVLQIDQKPLSRSFWNKIITAREQYLGNPPFPTLDALESYSESTYSSLHYLTLESNNLQSLPLDHIASHIGKASGIIAILRGTPHLASASAASNAAVVLPVDMCAEHGLQQEDLIRSGGQAQGLRDVVFAIATRANDHLITARKMIKEAGDEGTGVAFDTYLPAVSLVLYLQRLEKVDFDVYHTSLQTREWTLPWKAYWAYRRRKF